MRFIMMALAVLVVVSCSDVCFAIGEGKNKEAAASTGKEGSDPGKEVEKRVNTGGEKKNEYQERHPLYQERQSHPADRHFTDIRIQGPFRQ